MTTRLGLLRGVLGSTALCMGQNPGPAQNPQLGRGRGFRFSGSTDCKSLTPPRRTNSAGGNGAHSLHGECWLHRPLLPALKACPAPSDGAQVVPDRGPVTKKSQGEREGIFGLLFGVVVWLGSLGPLPNCGPENSQFSSRPLLSITIHWPPQVRPQLHGSAPVLRAQVKLPCPRHGDPAGP